MRSLAWSICGLCGILAAVPTSRIPTHGDIQRLLQLLSQGSSTEALYEHHSFRLWPVRIQVADTYPISRQLKSTHNCQRLLRSGCYASFRLSLAADDSLFHSRVPSSPSVEPSRPVPQGRGRRNCSCFLRKRVAGDLYDSLRVSAERILFGLLDVAGRREDNQAILSAAQATFRGLGASLFALAKPMSPTPWRTLPRTQSQHHGGC